MATTGRDQAPGEITVFRKYANRRLYDTTRARCVTLADIAERVREGRRVRVVNARGGADVTRQVLVQILCDTEANETGMLDEEVLARLIRLSHKPGGQHVSNTLGRALNRLDKHTPAKHNGPAGRRGALLHPKVNAETRAVATRIDALETRLRSLIARADGAAKRRGTGK